MRGAALPGHRGRRAARHERARGQQRAAARPDHARRHPRRIAAGRTCGGPRRPAQPVRRRLRALRHVRAGGLLHEDAVQSMPPFAMWIQGAENITTWMVQPGPSACRGSRLIPVHANGCPAFGQYKPDPRAARCRGRCRCWRSRGRRIARMTMFLDTAALFPSFGLPAHLAYGPAERRDALLTGGTEGTGLTTGTGLTGAGQLTRRPQAVHPRHSDGLLSAKILLSRAGIGEDQHAGRRTISGAAQAAARRDDRLRRTGRGARPRDARRRAGARATSTRSARWPRARRSRCAATRSSASPR